MATGGKDPTEAIRLKASQYPDVDKGTACTQTSFKACGKGFLYIGEQGGRYKAMFKLKDSIAEAEALAAKSPDDYQVGAGGYVTVRFTAEKPMPKKLWTRWLDESYALSAVGGGKKKVAKKAAKRVSARKATKKVASRTKTTRKKANP
ncbi:MAG TPA: MmcQ/YjbR family DNA-binding protein [Phycisphaerae bacterium]|nr:MmcQ/YjbR family DNA-binding protein [Phycisphaerae bacterium]HRW52000.1 MmcQ/YjbR family DNA-binding protein [Phycisphaerae bacterium]